MSSLSHDVERLRNIKTLPQIITYFRDELGWQIETTDIEEITFEYEPAELGFNNEEVVSFKESKQIRPLVADQPWGIFWISFDKKRLPVVMLRRILAHLAIKKRQTAKRGDRPAWDLHDLLFIVAYGEESDRAITLAHFWQDPQNPGNLAELKVLGWDGGDTVLHLADAHKMLTEKLRWPDDTRNINSWREQWASAFTLGHKEVIATTQELEVELARLAIAIRKRANSILSKESERGPLRNLFSVFKKTLIHDLTLEDFADVVAQTISYGLLAARLTSSSMISVQHLVEIMPATNPFLRDLLSSFLSVTGRGGNFDFDELGVQEVVELLNRANVDAVKRDFGNRTRDEDPVIHFYEHFLKAYDPEKKVKRGVFFTPQPVVSYIVRSVHELLQSEFSLDDGLASIITWGEMAERNEDLKIPKDTKPEDHFVTILDPATGTATFLVEVIDVIYRFLKEKWKKQGIPEVQQHPIWNDYVSKHLLPRFFGYELMMAPYVIAHLKIGIKLAETGYKFDSDERARIYLTNALEPPIEQTRMENIIPALAREAKEVNEIKQKKRFTVVIGNPPYSVSSSNKSEWIEKLAVDYKKNLNEKNIQPLSDDYIKFIRFGQYYINLNGIGILAYISNNSFIDGTIHRQMRKNLLENFNDIYILDLHGSSKKKEVAPDISQDKNVFDIMQGVSINLFVKKGEKNKRGQLYHFDLWGKRERKYETLLSGSLKSLEWKKVEAKPPSNYFLEKDFSFENVYMQGFKIDFLFKLNCIGIATGNDSELVSITPNTIAEKYKVSPHSYSYRPFDIRYTVFDNKILQRARFNVMKNMSQENIALQVTSINRQLSLGYIFISQTITDRHLLDSASDSMNTFPLYIYLESTDLMNFDHSPPRRPNLNKEILKQIADNFGLVFTNEKENKAGSFAPIDILDYVYAVLHSPIYRERYKDFLKIDFPRIPYPKNVETFWKLINLGAELRQIHLLESPMVNNLITTYPINGNNKVIKANFESSKIWINETQYFDNVPQIAWEFYIGGYQPTQKWLKDRKGSELNFEDIIHYQKIIVALVETDRLMKKIDEIVEF